MVTIKEGKHYKFNSEDGNTYYYEVVKDNSDNCCAPPELYIGLQLYKVNNEPIRQDITFLHKETFLDIQDKFIEVQYD